jgi:biopolymer transport protein ExbB
MRALVLFLVVFCVPSMASAWWNEAWPYRVPVTIDSSATGANVTSPVANVPVLIRLHSANFEDFFLVKEDLSDVRFIAQDDQTPLKFHVESFDLLNQLAFIWVQVPQISGTTTPDKVWMYYGNAESVSGENAGGTFDANQVSVFHFAEAEGLPLDSTGYQIPAKSLDGLITPASLIAGGLSLSGDGGMTVADSPAITMSALTGFTLSAWVKPIGNQANTVLFSKTEADNGIELAVDQAVIYAKINSAGKVIETPKTASLTLDTWQHVALVVTSSAVAIFVDGVEVASVAVELPDIAGDTVLGSLADKSRGFVGEVDELQFSNIARDSLWLQIAARTQGMASSAVFTGKGEQLGNAAGTSYFITIFQNTGTEGWVVILLLTVMAVLSWTVMAFKALFIGRAKKDNQAFLDQYQQLSGLDIASLDRSDDNSAEVANESQAASLFGKHDHFQSSPLYHLYHRAITEVKGRIGSVDSAKTHLNDASVNSIRSGLEAYMVREVQSLNRNMVLLTIAVSGGPFLGLLGTVLGVMITFAAIAASGDVNIAAIAPGVAAALLTTVAGLVVAIPALFGYNWLATRIKEMIADMHIFSDELVTKLAEQYSE